MADDWDFDDDDSIVHDGPINFFKKKEAIIELSSMIEYEDRPLTAEEIHLIFKREFDQSFPHLHFGFDTMEKFLDDVREVVHCGETAEGVRVYVANPQYKYHLLRVKAKGGKTKRPARSETNNTSFEVVGGGAQHQRDGGPPAGRGGRRGRTTRLVPSNTARVENGGSRFNGGGGAPTDQEVPNQNQQQQAHQQNQQHRQVPQQRPVQQHQQGRQQQGHHQVQQQRPQQQVPQGHQQVQQQGRQQQTQQGRQVQGHQQQMNQGQQQGHQHQQVVQQHQQPQQAVQHQKPVQHVQGRQQQPQPQHRVQSYQQAVVHHQGRGQQRGGGASQFHGLGRSNAPLSNMNRDVNPPRNTNNNGVPDPFGDSRLNRVTVAVDASRELETSWEEGVTDNSHSSGFYNVAKSEDENDDDEPLLVPIEGRSRIVDEKTLGGGRPLQPLQNTVPRPVSQRSYLDDILDLNLGTPQDNDDVDNASVVTIQSSTPNVAKEDEVVEDSLIVNGVPKEVTVEDLMKNFNSASEPAYAPETEDNNPSEKEMMDKALKNARDMLGKNFMKGIKGEPLRSVFDDLGPPNLEPPRQAAMNAMMNLGQTWNFSQHLPHMPTNTTFNNNVQSLVQQPSIMMSAAQQQRELSTNIEQMVLRTVASSTVVSETDVAFDDAVEFLKMAFSAVGKKLNVQCMSASVLAIIEANPSVFEFTAENGKEMVQLLRPIVGNLKKPGERLIQEATFTDIAWLAKAKTVAHILEPCDLVQIVYQTGDVILCTSMAFGVEDKSRIREISFGLEYMYRHGLMKPAFTFSTGTMYVVKNGDHYTRVIVISQYDGESFNTLLVDAPGELIVKIRDLWDVPEGWSVEEVPTNIYMARHAAKIGYSAKIADLITSAALLELYNQHEKTSADGIRFVDWLDVPERTSWFSGEMPADIDEMKNAIELRKISEYFFCEIAYYSTVMTPYSHRKLAAPNFVTEMNKLSQSMWSDKEDVETRKDIAAHGIGFFKLILKQFAVANEEVSSAVRFYKELEFELNRA